MTGIQATPGGSAAIPIGSGVPATPTGDRGVPGWVQDAIFYQIFPERFANGDPSIDPAGVAPWGSAPTRDGFMGGDLAGITQHLDHIAALGANALYLTPIFTAGTNHRYDAYDYFSVDPALGDLGAFRELLQEAHGRGIRVVLDAVLNHCGVGHPAFRDVIENGEDSEYATWFYVEGAPIRHQPAPNYRTCSGCWYLPKWNVHNPAVRAHHLKVARYWLEQGIDGWRLDVPYFVNMSFWRQFREVVKSVNPDAYIVAEEWRSPTQWLAGDTADGTMNYTLRDLVLGFTADGTTDAQALAGGLTTLSGQIPWQSRPAMLNLLGSHDTERLVTRHTDDATAARLAIALLVTSPGAPMIYYGDEIGMAGDNDPGCRGAMVWDRQRWDQETLAWVTELFALRTAHPALREGTDEFPYAVGDLLVRIRRSAQETIVIAVNRGLAAAGVPRAVVADGRLVPVWQGGGAPAGAVAADDAILQVPARSVRIWRAEGSR